MSEPFIAEIRIFPFNYPPRGWAFCWGGTLSISQFSALYSLVGTIYGGDGRVTLGLPDLRGRAPINSGTGPGLSSHDIGAIWGSETATLAVNQIPSHSHGQMMGNREAPANESATPVNGVSFYSNASFGNRFYFRPTDPSQLNAAMSPEAITLAGNGSPHENMQPYLAVQFCIALEGAYPARN